MLEPCTGKLVCTVLSGGKLERAYLSQLKLNLLLNELLHEYLGLNEILNLSPYLCSSIGLIYKRSEIKSSDKGFVKLNGKKMLITESELEVYISEYKQKAKDKYDKNKLSKSQWDILRHFFNGVFQAEGSISGQFNSKSSYKFNPKFSIGQNASTESIEFLAMMWAILGCNLKWRLSKTQTNNFHIQLESTNRAYIVSLLIPYFSLVYGEKYMALNKVLRLDALAKLNSVTLTAKAESIHLAYSLTSLGRDHAISLKEKLIYIVGEAFANEYVPNFKFSENAVPINLSFILGFFLGDGCLYIRWRDNVTGLAFVPKFEIKQRYTEANMHVMELVCSFLQNKAIKANLNINPQYILCVVEGINNVCNSLIPVLNEHKELYFWKTFHLEMTQQFGKLIALDSRNLYHIKYLIIKTLYSIDNNRDLPIEYWFKRWDEIFKSKTIQNISGELYISPVKDKVNNTGQIGWSVYLPEFLKTKPRTKYFYFSNFGSKDIALKEAIIYRDNIIDNWLLSEGYNIDPLKDLNSDLT